MKQQQLSALNELIAFMETAEKEKTKDVRLKLRSQIRDIVDKIVISPGGSIVTNGEKLKKVYDILIEDRRQDCIEAGLSKTMTKLELQRFKADLDDIHQPRKQLRTMVIYFKNGNHRFISPDTKNEDVLRLLYEFKEGQFIRHADL